MEESILADKRGPVGVITINRPERRNAISSDMYLKLAGLLESFGHDSEVRVIVIRGAGDKAFASGADIAELGSTGGLGRQALENRVSLMDTIENLDKPVIAMVKGYALGLGCELAVACDLRVASDTARFGIPAARMGITIPYGDTARLVRLIGPARTKEMLFTGRIIDAVEAKEIGLVNEVVAAGELESRVMALADQIAANAPLSVKGAKLTVNECLANPSLAGIDQIALSLTCYSSKDFREGVSAFLEKRAPIFTGS